MNTWIFPDVPSKGDLWSGAVFFNPFVHCCFSLFLIPYYFFCPPHFPESLLWPLYAPGLLLLTPRSPFLPPAISATAQARKLRQRLLAQAVLCISQLNHSITQ